MTICAPMFQVELIVKPRPGVRDPQGDAVQDALASIGHPCDVGCVGRYLSLKIEAPDRDAAAAKLKAMCESLLVNPNLETYEARIDGQAV